MPIKLKTQNITNMYTPIELVSTNVGQLAYYYGGGGITDHGMLHGLGDNDHPQYLLSSKSSQFMPVGNSASYQLTANNSLSLGTEALQSLFYTSNSSNLIALSNSTIYAVSNHTHTNIGGALSDHSHGPVTTVSTAGTNLTLASASNGLTVAVPNYITTAYGAAIKGNGTYSQNTGTIQFANSNGLTFGLNTNGVMTATMEYPNQVGILGISDGINSLQTNSSIKFADANGISFRLNGSTMNASYTVPGITQFSNSNNVQFGLAGSTVTAIALFAQSTQTENMHNITLAGNTAGTMAQVSSGTLTLAGGNNITLSQAGNHISIVGPPQMANLTLGGNTSGTLTLVSTGTMTIAGGNNITLSQNGNAFTIVGPTPAGLQTFIGGLAVSNTTYTSGSVYISAQNNITIGSYVSSNSQYIRLSVPNFLSTAALSDHTHGSNVSTASTTGSNMQFTSASNGLTIGVPAWGTGFIATSLSTLFGGSGFTTVSTSGTDIMGTHNSLGLNLAIPKYITTAGLSTHTHGTPTLSLTNLTGSISSASNGLTLSMTAYPATSFVNVSETGNVYFMNGNGFYFSSSTSGLSTSIYLYS